VIWTQQQTNAKISHRKQIGGKRQKRERQNKKGKGKREKGKRKEKET
jgi:hypothetical protein